MYFSTVFSFFGTMSIGLSKLFVKQVKKRVGAVVSAQNYSGKVKKKNSKVGAFFNRYNFYTYAAKNVLMVHSTLN